MDLQLTDEQQMAQKAAAEFAKNEVLPKLPRLIASTAIPRAGRPHGELGFMGIAIPEEFGGAGLDTVSYALVLEEISRACASTGVMSVNNSLVCDPINKFGTEEQKRTWLTPLAQGRLLGCFALSEPEAGSDAAAQKTIARPAQGPDGEGFIINGVKLDHQRPGRRRLRADLHVGSTGARPGTQAITAFIPPMNTPGCEPGRPTKSWASGARSRARSSSTMSSLPKSQLLGEVGQGFRLR